MVAQVRVDVRELQAKTSDFGNPRPDESILEFLFLVLRVRVLVAEAAEMPHQHPEVFDPRDGDVAEKVREATGGRGADAGFECSSVPAVLDMLLDAVAPGGVIVNVSIWGHKPEVDMPKLVLKEIDLRGTIGYANDHPDTIALVQRGKLDLAPLITGRIGLDELISEGFDQLINNNEEHVKIIVDPRA